MGTFIEEQKKKKLEQLLSSGFDLFTDKGFSKTTISDIVNHAGVAKGTFYLYFKDKYDLRSLLIQHKAAALLDSAYQKLLGEIKAGNIPPSVEEGIYFIMDDILRKLNEDRSLLVFLSKNLSWGIFRNTLEQMDQETVTSEKAESTASDDSSEASESKEKGFLDNFLELIAQSGEKFHDPEVGLFLIVELVSSAGFTAIMYQDPVDFEQLMPHLKKCIHDILETYRVKE